MDSLELDIALHLLKLLTAILLVVDYGFLLDDREDLSGRSPGVGKHLQGGERMPQGHRANHHPKENLSQKKNIFPCIQWCQDTKYSQNVWSSTIPGGSLKHRLWTVA